MASNTWNSRPYPPSSGASSRGSHFRPINQRNSDRDSRRDSRNGSYGFVDNYDPRANGRDSYHPPPPRDQPPLPPPPTYSQNAPGYSASNTDSYRPPQSDFTFRSEMPAGVRSMPQDNYRPSYDSRGRGRGSRGGFRGDGRRGRGGGHFQPRLAANRSILHMDHSAQALTNDFGAAQSGATYLPVQDLSDNDEAEMDISGEEDDGEPSKKKARTASNGVTSENAAEAKWSNPDPYFVLPPTNTAQKNKDVVAMIRKARVQPKDTDASAPADVEDFIACDSDSASERQSPPRDAPTGPRRSSRTEPLDQSSNRNNNQEHQRPSANKSTDSYRPGDSLRGGGADQYRPGSNQRASDKPQASRDSKQELNPSRKRTHRDEIKLPEHAKLKKGTKMPVGGFISFDWRISPKEDPCPWLKDHSETPQMGVWLHKEIMDFYNHVKPQPFEQRLRQDLVDELNRKTRPKYPDATIHAFGSFMSGLYLPTGDMDLVICSDGFLAGLKAPVYSSKKQLWKYSAFLERAGLAQDMEVITKAKVPLVKYIDSRTGLKVDVSFENTTGLTAIGTFLAWKEKYPAMPILVTLIKQFLLMRGLNEPMNGGIGGFTVICLVVSMLQLMPQVQSQNLVPEHHLGEMLLHFLDLYGNKFQYETTAIRMTPPGYIAKHKVNTLVYKSPDRLSIIDPNRADNDISGGSSNFAAIARVFSESHDVLQRHMAAISKVQGSKRRKASLLSVLMEGNYSTFRLQRAYLQEVHDRRYGSNGGPPVPDSPPREKQIYW